jgi:hypothetical protein
MMAKKNNWHFKILLGDDRSEHALAAVALLEDLLFSSGTDITVFRAVAPRGHNKPPFRWFFVNTWVSIREMLFDSLWGQKYNEPLR